MRIPKPRSTAYILLTMLVLASQTSIRSIACSTSRTAKASVKRSVQMSAASGEKLDKSTSESTWKTLLNAEEVSGLDLFEHCSFWLFFNFFFADTRAAGFPVVLCPIYPIIFARQWPPQHTPGVRYDSLGDLCRMRRFHLDLIITMPIDARILLQRWNV